MLPIVRSLFDDFKNQEVKYCHFKSNQHLVPALCGKTDLDVLIQREHYAAAIKTLAVSGFKRYSSKLVTMYPGVEDWIGFDYETGALVHLHLHWQLTAGEPKLKGYRIPWESSILESRLFERQNSVFISSHEHELILLLTRMSLKYRFRDRLRKLTGREFVSKADFVTEFLWLKHRVDSIKLGTTAQDLLSIRASEIIIEMLNKAEIQSSDFNRLRQEVLLLLRPYRTYHPVVGRAMRWIREFYLLTAVLMSKYFKFFVPKRRVPSTGGITVAILGPDGSGKSSQVNQVMKWLGWKVDVGYIYFGSGEGPTSLLRRIFTSVAKFFLRSSRGVNPHANTNECAKQSKSILKKVYRMIWAFLLLREKSQRLIKLTRARNKGIVMVCDRYPQNQFQGVSDGPLLSEWLQGSGIWRKVAGYEKRAFEKFATQLPDIVIKLKVSHSTALSRKSDTPNEQLTKKVEVLENIQFPSQCHVYEVDADQSLSTVTLEVRKIIWQHI